MRFIIIYLLVIITPVINADQWFFIGSPTRWEKFIQMEYDNTNGVYFCDVRFGSGINGKSEFKITHKEGSYKESYPSNENMKVKQFSRYYITFNPKTKIIKAKILPEKENSNENKTMIQFWHPFLNRNGDYKEYDLYKELIDKGQELSNFGFTNIWIPPAYKTIRPVNNFYDYVGYSVYDYYDLGEFDQQGSIRTKYGIKDDLDKAIDLLNTKYNITVTFDMVFNHLMGGSLEKVDLLQRIEIITNEEGKYINKKILDDISNCEIFSKFTYDGRIKNQQNNYSTFKWSSDHFDGTDTIIINNEIIKHDNIIYKINNKEWDDVLELPDYFLGMDIDLNNDDVIKELDKMGIWLLDQYDNVGFRIDAAARIEKNFIESWVSKLERNKMKDIFTVLELYEGDINKLMNYYNSFESNLFVFDISLHYQFKKLSAQKEMQDYFETLIEKAYKNILGSYINNKEILKLTNILKESMNYNLNLNSPTKSEKEIKKILSDSIEVTFEEIIVEELTNQLKEKHIKDLDLLINQLKIKTKIEINESFKSYFNIGNVLYESALTRIPHNTVTFVDNHDTMPGGDGFSWVDPWFRSSAYTIILLWENGIPCVFYPDLYGAEYEVDGKKYVLESLEILPDLLEIRKKYAYGKQISYFKNKTNIGWSRLGNESHPKAMAVLISNEKLGTTKSFRMNVNRPNTNFINLLGNDSNEIIKTDQKGFGNFKVTGKSVAIWVEQ